MALKQTGIRPQFSGATSGGRKQTVIERNQQEHNTEVVNQFTKQAIPFTKFAGHLESIQMLIEMSKVSSDDLVLDVACGPGLLACEFAKAARHVTGIDITEKMIDQARKRQGELGLTNVSWDIGTVMPLPYNSASFSLVITRYSFHHFLDPKAVVKEMIRVCKPNGVVLIADAALPANKVDAYNSMEKLRDPSHTQALSCDAWEQLVRGSELRDLRRGRYKIRMELDQLLKGSFPNSGEDEKIRDIFKNDLGINSLGMDVHLSDNKIYLSYPISIYAGNK